MVIARGFFALQAVAGALWWLGVFVSVPLRRATLGNWSPQLLVIPDLLFFVVGSLLTAVLGRWWIGAVVGVWTAGLTVALTIHGMLERTAGWGIIAMAAATVCSALATGTLRHRQLPTQWFFVGPFRFRVADSAGPRTQLRRGLVQLVIFWVIFFGLIPALLSLAEIRVHLRLPLLAQPAVGGVGIALFLLASPFAVAAMITMARKGDGTPLPARTARELVTDGPYARVRNPMATAGVVQVIGIGLLLGSWTTIAIAVLGALAWQFGIRPSEEADLERRFGEPYRRYRAEV